VETRVSSYAKEICIGPDRPFVVIGERINPTGRKKLAAEMAAGDFSRVIQDAHAQLAAGAHMLDVNAGIPLADEPAILAAAIQIVQSITDAPLSIDSSIVAALESGLAVYQGKALVNSVTGDGISNDETGISENPDVRLSVAKKIIERAQDHGIPRADVLIDPLVMPIGAMRTAGRQVFEIVRRCRDELKVNTCCGASNVSFGLPNRGPLNGAFLAMAIGAGLTSAITNPIEEHIKTAIMAADVMTGNDENCLNWIMANRTPQPQGESAGGPRRERRMRRS